MTIWELMQSFGFQPIVWIMLFLVGLGVYKFIKDWLPW